MTITTLAEAEAEIDEALRDGRAVKCPCCEQTVKRYNRTIHKTMWHSLLVISKHDGINAKDIGQELPILDTRDYPLMRYWDLIQQDIEGNWYITERGRDFVDGKIQIPRYAYVYNSTLLGFSDDDLIGASECQSRFSLAEATIVTGHVLPPAPPSASLLQHRGTGDRTPSV